MSRYRLPAEIRLGPVRLQVGDLARSLDYYQSVLGLVSLDRGPDQALLGAGTTPLVRLQERKGAVPATGRAHLGLFHYALLLPDRASLGRLLAHLSDLGIVHGSSDHLVSEAVYLSDPDGLGIEVYSDRPRSSWRELDGELQMATLPLDRAAVLASAGSAWTGIPAGTRMGHMHLSVGNLVEAGRFYEEGLGLTVMVRSYPGALFLAAGGYHHHLGLNTWAGPRATRPASDQARLLEWELVLPSSEDVDAAASGLSAAGFPPQQSQDGWRIDDPWGTSLRVTAAF